MKIQFPETKILFDDGFQSVMPFSDQLKAFSPMMSIITGYIGGESNWDLRLGGYGKNHLTKENIRNLSDKGWLIISHTVTHRALDVLSDDQVRLELIQSKNKIEDLTGKSCQSLSFPFGRFNEKVLDIALSAGYEHFYSNRLGLTNQKVHSVYSVYRWDDISTVRKKLERNYLERRKLQLINYCSGGTVLLQKILGNKNL